MEDLKEYLESIDPFKIPLDKYRELLRGDNSLVGRMIMRRLDELHGSWIRGRLRELGAQSIVVCDGKVVYASRNRYEPPDEELRRMEDEMGKPCYVVTGEPLIEGKSGWSYLSVGDYYPTLEISLGRIDWSEEEVFKKGVKVNCDFDTGNPEYTVLSEEVCGSIAQETVIGRMGYHLGMPYLYYPRRMRVGVTDGEQGRCIDKIVEGVDNWHDAELNPYRIANPRREGFVGRDLMLKLFFRITLDPGLKESAWRLL